MSSHYDTATAHAKRERRQHLIDFAAEIIANKNTILITKRAFQRFIPFDAKLQIEMQFDQTYALDVMMRKKSFPICRRDEKSRNQYLTGRTLALH